MNPQLIAGIVIVLVWLASVGGAGVYEYRNGVTVTKAAYEKQQIEVDAKSAKLISEKDAAILEGGTQHGKDQIIIDRLAGQLADANSLPIHFPTAKCSGNAKVGTDTNGASGMAESGVDAAFRHLQEGTGALIKRCSQLNIDAIQSNTANK